MSEIYQVLGDIVSDRAASNTDAVTLADGSTITAEIESGIDPFVVQSALGEDIREAVKLNIASRSDAAKVSRGEFVQFTLFGCRIKAKAVKRVEDPGSPFVVFWVVKSTQAD